MTDDSSSDDARAQELAASLRDLARWVRRTVPTERAPHPIVTLLSGFLDDTARAHSVVSRDLPPFEHVNLQVALDEWRASPDRSVDVHGIAVPPHHMATDLQQLILGEEMHHVRLAPPTLIDLPDGPGSTRACLVRALLLVEDRRGRFVIMVSGPVEHEHGLRVAIAGLPVAEAQAVLSELDAERSRLNVFRGHVLDVSVSEMGGVRLTFGAAPDTSRADVVLPLAVLERIERHALGVSRHQAALLAAGQHLKRGLLLYGPPGTGKTHTTRYLVGQMAGYSRFLLTGRSLHAIGSVTDLARELAPAVIVLEDVDLVAQDREFGHGSSTVLFDLLDAMDGAAADADLLFLLTTNRADLLEPALAARPGRVDVAVEIALPDAEARRVLFDLYGGDMTAPLDDAEVAEVVSRTEGVTASFLKELVRRSYLESLHESASTTVVQFAHVSAALDDLLDSTQEVTRSLLGVGVDPETLESRPIPNGPPYYQGGTSGVFFESWSDEED